MLFFKYVLNYLMKFKYTYKIIDNDRHRHEEN